MRRVSRVRRVSHAAHGVRPGRARQGIVRRRFQAHDDAGVLQRLRRAVLHAHDRAEFVGRAAGVSRVVGRYRSRFGQRR